ncbi:MAG: UbiX family flavin prenyltransferase [Desulfobacterota bacterium]|nr:UbiX family flavin prenyltransferase [Thermodesulfobacteriota bacterium]
MRRLVIGLTGATGAIYGIRLLEFLSKSDVESHLVISTSAEKTIRMETHYTLEQVKALATVTYNMEDVGADISSGSFHTEGMVVIPCSIKSLSAIANSYNENLLIRAADVTLKERRKLVLVVRETPLHRGHLSLMLNVADAGAVILPPIPAFYFLPKTLDDIINHTVGRALDVFNIDHSLFNRWGSKKLKNALKAKGTSN